MSHFGDLLKGKVTAPVVDEVPSKPEVVTVVETSNEGEVNFSGMSKKQLENYGRTVGYEVIEHVPPKDIGEISATKIRETKHFADGFHEGEWEKD